MTTNTNRNLAKGLWPVLLLSATLSLPAVSLAAPSPNGKAHAADKDDKKNQKKGNVNRGNAQWKQEQRRQEAKHSQLQRQAEARRQAELNRQAELRRQAERNALLQRQSNQRQLQLQRQAEARRLAELQRQRQAQQRYNNQRYNGDRYAQRYDDRYYRNRYGSYGYRSNGQQEHIDGFVIEERGDCVLVKEHRTGQIFSLFGNVGDMREGDHLRYVGIHTHENYCDDRYPAMEVREMKTLWSNDRHEHAVFDANRDGSYDRWYDRYYDDRYRH